MRRNVAKPDRGRGLCLGGRALLVGLTVIGVAGCSLPEPKVPRDQILRAAKDVIAQRYPTMHAVSERDGQLVAVSPVTVSGSSRTRKQISVVIQRSYTGSYDPVVKVVQLVEVGTPYLDGNPESPSVAAARPIAPTEWQPVDTLPYEEQAIYEAIHQKLGTRGM